MIITFLSFPFCELGAIGVDLPMSKLYRLWGALCLFSWAHGALSVADVQNGTSDRASQQCSSKFSASSCTDHNQTPLCTQADVCCSWCSSTDGLHTLCLGQRGANQLNSSSWQCNNATVHGAAADNLPRAPNSTAWCSNSSEQQPVLVIGAGVAGLAAARALEQGDHR